MKFYLHQLSIVFIVLLFGNAIDTKDQIIGKWVNPDKTRKVEIFKKNELYFGKILWLKESKNGKAKPGDIVMFDIQYTKNKWIGKIKIPSKENVFDMQITMPTIDELQIKGTYGLFSKTKVWSRVP
jgi:uncharacterized protein (DUF2147 family)